MYFEKMFLLCAKLDSKLEDIRGGPVVITYHGENATLHHV